MGLRELVLGLGGSVFPPSVAGPLGHQRGPARPAVWLQVQVCTGSCPWLLESGDSRCESIQPFASVTSDGPLKCVFPHPTDGDAGLCAPPECGLRWENRDKALGKPLAHSPGAALRTGVAQSHFLHFQAPGLAGPLTQLAGRPLLGPGATWELRHLQVACFPQNRPPGFLFLQFVRDPCITWRS